MLNLSDDIIDVRDLIDEFERLRSEEESATAVIDRLDAIDQAEAIAEILNQLRGYGGDHQWDGCWFPDTLIRDSYFVTYAKELAHDLGLMNHSRLDETWPLYCIDWERAAAELQIDYATVDIEGADYWYR